MLTCHHLKSQVGGGCGKGQHVGLYGQPLGTGLQRKQQEQYHHQEICLTQTCHHLFNYI